ncbi:MAG: response regulator [Planctomycetes bacterium]|nr:response regulator [Planctomycetota bacterium]
MIELAWFAAGACASLATVLLWRARRPAPADATGPADPAGEANAAETAEPPQQEPSPPPPVPAAAHSEPDCHGFALSLAEELATLVSGVEGRAHALIECAPHRALLPAAAEGLLASIQRLRTLHRKLVAYASAHPSAPGETDLGELVPSLVDDLQHLQLGLELRWMPAPALPRVAGNRDVLREALYFLGSSLLRAERGATRLSIDAELGLAGETPAVQLQLDLEWACERSGQAAGVTGDVAFTFEHEAAANLLHGLGGSVSFTHRPGQSASAVVTLPAATEVAAAAPAAAAGPALAEARHRYGGALLLETDPSIRAMLANELKATGRAVFACADGAAAQSFLAATPERFEILILDHPRRLSGDDALGETIRTRAPGLKICVLGSDHQPLPEAWPQLHRIAKPFGVYELRQALASVLAAG